MPAKTSKPADSDAASAQAKDAAKSLHWLSQDYGELVREVVDGSAPVFDVLIVGSGYGGAIAAATLAGKASKKSDGTPAKPLSVCVLERGKEFLPGTFPARMPELATQFRYCNAESAEAQRERTGLFDMRLDGDVAAVLANGLGGGSLISRP